MFPRALGNEERGLLSAVDGAWHGTECQQPLQNLLTMKMVVPVSQPHTRDLAHHSEQPLLLFDGMLLAERERKKDSKFFCSLTRCKEPLRKLFLEIRNDTPSAAQQPCPAAAALAFPAL